MVSEVFFYYCIVLLLLACTSSLFIQKGLSRRIPADLFGHRNENAFRQKGPKARLGGIGIFAGFIVSGIGLFVIVWNDSRIKASGQLDSFEIGIFFFSLILIFLLGVLDDLVGLTAATKLPVEIAAASILYCHGFAIDLFPAGNGADPQLWQALVSYLISMLWIVGLTNAMNLIDGIDGLAGTVSLLGLISLLILISRSGSSILALLLVGMIGAVLGFLRFNLHPARIYLGDSGSLLLGFFMAAVSMKLISVLGSVGALGTVFIFFIPVFDLVSSFLRRLLNGKNPFRADFQHLHHRLMDKNCSEWGAYRFLTTVTLVLCVIGILIPILPVYFGWLSLVVLGSLAVLLWRYLYRGDIKLPGSLRFVQFRQGPLSKQNQKE